MQIHIKKFIQIIKEHIDKSRYFCNNTTQNLQQKLTNTKKKKKVDKFIRKNYKTNLGNFSRGDPDDNNSSNKKQPSIILQIHHRKPKKKTQKSNSILVQLKFKEIYIS